MNFKLKIFHPDFMDEVNFDSINLECAKRKVNRIIKGNEIFNDVKFRRWSGKVGMYVKSVARGKYCIIRASDMCFGIKLFLKWEENNGK